MKRLLMVFVKFGVPLAILVWLVQKVSQDVSFEQLWTEKKDWSLMALALVLCFAAVVVTFIRWYFLVRALDVPFKLRDAFRLGFLGYLFNFVTPGGVGGDLFKAVFIVREQPTRKAAAVSSVIFDRLIGLYALFLVSSLALWLTDEGRASQANGTMRAITQATWTVTLISTVVGLVLLLPHVTDSQFSLRLTKVRFVGHVWLQIATALRLYRKRLGIIALALVLSMGVHSLFAGAFYCIAKGLPGDAPDLAAHLVIVPLSMLVGVLPLVPNGLGLIEAAVESLYHLVPAPGLEIDPGKGMVVSLGYRVATLLIACIGVAYYLSRRREVEELRHASEHAPDVDESDLTKPTPRIAVEVASSHAA